jgi:hypothetical protein
MSEELQLEEQISQELVKQNVTQAVISGLKEKYAHLKISGIEDKETYLLVKEGRKECKAFRVLAKKICEKGREDAVAIQKAWVKKQKEVTDEIAAIEDPLEEQERGYEAAVAKEKEESKRRQEEQLIMRQQVLTGMGALYSDGSFHLGEVSFELSVVKESEPDIWEESILPKFKEEYEKVEAERLEQERVKRERESEMKRQQEELERKQKELADKEAALKLAQEEQERKQKEEEAKKAFEENVRIDRLWRSRLDRLNPIGWNGQEAFAKYDESVIVATHKQLIEMSDGTFENVLTIHQQNVAADAEQKEQKRLAEIEAQKDAERIMTLGKSRIGILKQYMVDKESELTIEAAGNMAEMDWEIIRTGWQDVYDKKQKEKWEKEQKEKLELEELRKQQELALSGDKVKWAEIIKQIDEITLYTMISVQYKKKLGIMREKLEEIKAL